MKKTLIAVAAGLMLLATQASASVVEFTYTSSIVWSNIGGANVGDTLTIKLLADNGNTGLASQNWAISDIISGSLSAGTYSQSYVDGWFSHPSMVAFSTNAATNLVASTFYGTTSSQNHEDSFGIGNYVYLANGSFTDFFGNWAAQAHSLAALPNWSVAEVSNDVPEPGSLALLALGIAGAACVRRRVSKA